MPTQASISAIVPVYNVEAYLQQCLDSILAQSYTDFELIAVDDGSTDASAALLDRYAQSDARVRVIHRENAGYGSAVNAGLDQARGQWISIIEPDDFVGPQFFEDLISNVGLEGGGVADIVKSSFWFYYDECEECEEHLESPKLAQYMPDFRCETCAAECPELVRQHPSIWSALYRRDFLLVQGIRMRELPGAAWADNPWMCDTMLRAAAIVWIPGASYYYRQTNAGCSTRLGDYRLPYDRLRDMRRIYEELGVHEAGLMDALYSRTLTYTVKHVLYEGGFSEADEGLQELIREAFSSLDRRRLLATGNLISREHKDYYRDFMGMKLAAVRKRPAQRRPAASVLLALRDDREGLWKTVESLLAQEAADFEVLCVDCGTSDRSASIARGIAERDERFRLLGGQADSVGQGWVEALGEARADHVLLLRPGVELGRGYLVRLKEALGRAECAGADVVVAESDTARLKTSRMAAAKQAVRFEGQLWRGRVAQASAPSVYGKCFDAAFLRRHAAFLQASSDPEGADAWLLLLARAESAAFAAVPPVETALRTHILVKQGRTSGGLVAFCMKRYRHLCSLDGFAGGEAAASRAPGDAAAAAEAADEVPALARTVLANLMAQDLRSLAFEREGSRLHEGVSKVFDEGGLAADLVLRSCAPRSFRLLDMAAHCSHAQLVALLAAEEREQHQAFKRRVDASALYRAEQAARAFAKRAAPASLVRRVTGR